MTPLRALLLIVLLPLAAGAQSRSDHVPLATTSVPVAWHPPVSADPETVALSGDGRFLATSDSLRITVWDVASGEPRALFPIHPGFHPITTPVPIALSPDGRYLARGGHGSAVIVIDVVRGRDMAMLRDSLTPPGHRDSSRRVTAIAYAPDGASLAAAHMDGTISLFDMAGGSGPFIIDSGTTGCRLLRFSPDGRYLAAGGSPGGTIRLIDLAHPRRTRVLAMRRDTGLFSDPPSLGPASDEATIAFSGDGHTIVGALASGRLMSWEVETGARASEVNLTGVDSTMPAIAISPTEAMAAFAYANGTVAIMSLDHLSTLRTYVIPPGGRWVFYAPDGRSLFIAGAAHAVIQLDLTTGAILREFGGGHPEGVRALARSGDNSMLASTGNDAMVILRDPGTMRILGVLNAPVPSNHHLSPKAYGQHILAFISRDSLRHCFMEVWGGSLRVWERIWNPIERRLIEQRRFDITARDNRTIYYGALSPKGYYIAYRRPWGKVIVNRVSDGAPIDTISNQPPEPEITGGHDPESFAFSPDESRIAVSYRDGLVGIYELATGRMVDSIHAPSAANHLTFAPDGKALHFRAHVDLMTWNLINDSSHLRRTYHEHIPLAATPDGRWLVSGHAGGPRMIALPDLRVVHALHLHPGPISKGGWSAATIAPDLSTITIGTHDGALGVVHISESALGREEITRDTIWQTTEPIGLDRYPFDTVPDTTSDYTWSVVSSRSGEYTAISHDGDRIITGKNRVPLLWHPEDVKPRPLHQNSTISAAFSPGGDTIAFGKYGSFVLADAATGRTLRTFDYDGGEEAGDITYSPDGRHVAFVTKTGYFGRQIIMLWDITASSPAKRLWFRGERYAMFGFSRDGSLLAVGSEVGDTLYIYDVPRDTLRFMLTPVPGRFPTALRSNSAVFSEDGEKVFFASRTGRLSVFRTTDGVLERTIDFGTSSNVRMMSISPDASMIVGTTFYDTVHAWSTADGTLLWTITNVGTPDRIRFYADGRRLLLHGSNENLTLLDPRSGQVMNVVGVGHGSGIVDLVHSHDNRMVASTDGRWIKIWDVASGQLVRSLPVPLLPKLRWIRRIAFSGDDRYLALLKVAGNGERVPFHVIIINAETGNVVRELEGVCLDGRVSISNDARRLAFVAPDSIVVTGSLPYWTDVAVLPVEREPIGLDWSPRGDSLVVFNSEGTVSIFDITSQALARRIPYRSTEYPEERVSHLNAMRGRLRPDHLRANWLLRENTPETWRLMHYYKVGSSTDDGSWSVVATEYDGALQVARSAGSTTHYFVLRDPIVSGGHRAVSIAPDGSSIAVGTYDGSIILWKTIP